MLQSLDIEGVEALLREITPTRFELFDITSAHIV